MVSAFCVRLGPGFQGVERYIEVGGSMIVARKVLGGSPNPWWGMTLRYLFKKTLAYETLTLKVQGLYSIYNSKEVLLKDCIWCANFRRDLMDFQIDSFTSLRENLDTVVFLG